MTFRTILSFAAYVISIALFVTWFVRARALRGDSSEWDRDRKRQLTWVMVGAFAALLIANVL